MAAVKNNQPKPRILTRRAKGRRVSLDPRDYQPLTPSSFSSSGVDGESHQHLASSIETPRSPSPSLSIEGQDGASSHFVSSVVENDSVSGEISLTLSGPSVEVTETVSSSSSSKGKGKKRALQAYTGVTKKSSHKKAICSLEDSTGKDRFEKDDINRIMDWLDDPLNYGAVYGFPGTTPPPGTPVMNSNTAYGKLADTVNRASGGRFRLNAKSMRERWGRHKSKYVATKKIVESTGFGINDADRAKRIFSIAAKKEKLCLGYQRMDAIFGTKPNITPLAEYDSTLSPAETQPADPYYDLDLPSEWDRDDYEMHCSHTDDFDQYSQTVLEHIRESEATQSLLQLRRQDVVTSFRDAAGSVIVNDPAGPSNSSATTSRPRAPRTSTPANVTSTSSSSGEGSSTRKPLSSLNVGSSTPKGSMISAFERMAQAKADATAKIAEDRLAWEKVRWEHEQEERREGARREAEREERRLRAGERDNRVNKKVDLLKAAIERGIVSGNEALTMMKEIMRDCREDDEHYR
ncbi:hypothetical protein K457DRAFT_16272 [Linnemannia elongata AG-77]|uniref:Uncharacterized protein n=1 Tax=Linnemannia elongata AG-77 TaxID=1314771 RepID=A0A197K8G9_9FUNG|nr:hypothetical protein K457DRAFT_16272 [Linnemannia elongata AG-77]